MRGRRAGGRCRRLGEIMMHDNDRASVAGGCVDSGRRSGPAPNEREQKLEIASSWRRLMNGVAKPGVARGD
jgi:hypothetical protein